MCSPKRSLSADDDYIRKLKTKLIYISDAFNSAILAALTLMGYTYLSYSSELNMKNKNNNSSNKIYPSCSTIFENICTAQIDESLYKKTLNSYIIDCAKHNGFENTIGTEKFKNDGVAYYFYAAKLDNDTPISIIINIIGTDGIFSNTIKFNKSGYYILVSIKYYGVDIFYN